MKPNSDGPFPHSYSHPCMTYFFTPQTQIQPTTEPGYQYFQVFPSVPLAVDNLAELSPIKCPLVKKLDPMGLTDGMQKDLHPTESELLAAKTKTNNLAQYSCSCVKSHCLKEYCLCFKKGSGCSSTCSCKMCRNTQNNLNEKLKFPEKTKKCRCAKSQCIKKYCECYSANRKCEQSCECIGCEN